MSSNLDVGPFSGGNTAVFQDVRASGVAGQTWSGSVQTAEFNTEIVPKSFVSESTNQFTMDAGIYLVRWRDSFTTAANEYIQVYAYDTVGSVNVGGARICNPSDADKPDTTAHFYINLSASKVIEIRLDASNAVSSVKDATGNGSFEYYQEVSFTKEG